MNPGATEKSLLDWHVAARAMDDQAVSGDLHLVKAFAGGMLLAVVDGVGHGEEATAAARTAVSVLEAHAQEPVIPLTKRCHEALRRTRGVVMTVASLNAIEQSVTWLGVGNVEGRLLRAEAGVGHPTESVLLRGGLVGLRLPALQASVLMVTPGDLLVLATDGIHAGFDARNDANQGPRQIADSILARYFKGTDDALVLAARYLGRHDE